MVARGEQSDENRIRVLAVGLTSIRQDLTAPYPSGSRRGWAKVKAPNWHEKKRERFRRRP